jgi:Domain of unknown function (DUF4160)
MSDSAGMPRHLFLATTHLGFDELELGQILPYIMGDPGSADARDQAVWQLQAPDVLPGREPAARTRQGTDFAAKIRISNGDLLAGEVPNNILKQARRWVEGHRAELLAMWDEFQR